MEPEIEILVTVRFTSLSVITLPCTVRFPVTSAAPETVSGADGLVVPIPRFHAFEIRIFSEFAVNNWISHHADCRIGYSTLAVLSIAESLR